MRIKNTKALFIASFMILSVLSSTGCSFHKNDPDELSKRTSLETTEESNLDDLPDTQDVSAYRFCLLTDDGFKDASLGELMNGELSDGTAIEPLTIADLNDLKAAGVEFLGYINEAGETIIVEDVDPITGEPYNRFTVEKINNDGSMVLNFGTEDDPRYANAHRNGIGELVLDLDDNNAVIGDEVGKARLDKRNKEDKDSSDDSSDSDQRRPPYEITVGPLDDENTGSGNGNGGLNRRPNNNTSDSGNMGNTGTGNGGSTGNSGSGNKPSSNNTSVHDHVWNPITTRVAVSGNTGYYANAAGDRISPIDVRDNLSDYTIIRDAVGVYTDVCNKCGFTLYDLGYHDGLGSSDLNGIFSLKISSSNQKDFDNHVNSCKGEFGSGSSSIVEDLVSVEYRATWVRLGTTVYVDEITGYECIECGAKADA